MRTNLQFKFCSFIGNLESFWSKCEPMGGQNWFRDKARGARKMVYLTTRIWIIMCSYLSCMHINCAPSGVAVDVSEQYAGQGMDTGEPTSHPISLILPPLSCTQDDQTRLPHDSWAVPTVTDERTKVRDSLYYLLNKPFRETFHLQKMKVHLPSKLYYYVLNSFCNLKFPPK